MSYGSGEHARDAATVTGAGGAYLRNVSFLVVDPSAFMRRTVIGILRFFGATDIREAADGAVALQILQGFTPDIILTEYLMEPLDGLDMTRILRRDPAPAKRFVPVIMVTSWSEVWRVRQARDVGVTEFVVKPFSARTLMLRVQEVIANPRAFVRATGYFGPDRRRRAADERRGRVALRRAGDPCHPAAGHATQEEADALMAGGRIAAPADVA